MIPRRYALLLLLVTTIWPLLAGCGRPGTPTPAPLPWPVASPTASPVVTVAPQATTPQPTVQPQVFAPGRPTPVPILYKMFDYGTDFQNEHPEYGPVGSMHWTLWERVNPGPGAYDWSYIDDKLALEAPLKVTLLDGREIPKPVVIQVFTHLSSAPNWNADFYDGTPRWVYDRIDRQQPGDRRPVVGGRPVGYALTGCGKTAVLPMYDNQTWREAHYAMIRAFGARYNDHPQVTAVMIATGLDAETQIVKDWGCQWN
ncbi:MAG: hypothetical protein FJZ90_02135, partial [Chloroflexi bacterium]|nr:hypothetical protein [Chloroflexota bacterium]